MSTQYARDKRTGEFRGSVAGTTAPLPSPTVTTVEPVGTLNEQPDVGYQAAVSQYADLLAQKTAAAEATGEPVHELSPVATPEATPATPSAAPAAHLSFGARLAAMVQRMGPDPAKQPRRW